jgi:hypothetical protein
LDTVNDKWDLFRSHVYREGHSALFIGNNDVIVYGGCTSDITESSEQLHGEDLVVYNTISRAWRRELHLGSVPKSRSRHAACLSEDETMMFVSGGLKLGKLEPYDDLYCYSFENRTWSGPKKFVGRFDHSIIHQGDKIWAFGGLNKEMGHTSELTWYDLVTGTIGTTKLDTIQRDETDHIFLSTGNPNLVLDVVVPSWSLNNVEPRVGMYDLKSMRYSLLIESNFRHLLSHRWRMSFVCNEKLYLVGYPLKDGTMDATYDYELSHILSIDMGDICHQKDVLMDTICSDFAKLLFQDMFSDFKIYALNCDERPSVDISHEEIAVMKSKPIPAHKLILYARWPHFQMIENSGMLETQTGTLFITEPISWVRALIEYLYTNEVAVKTLDNMTGLLVLANIYRLSALRTKCLSWLSTCESKTSTVLTVWSRARMAQEEVLEHNAVSFCFQNWGKIVNTDEFKELPKEDIVSLCQQVAEHGLIVNRVEDENRDVSVHSSRDANSYEVRIEYRSPRRNQPVSDEESSLGATSQHSWWS